MRRWLLLLIPLIAAAGLTLRRWGGEGSAAAAHAPEPPERSSVATAEAPRGAHPARAPRPAQAVALRTLGTGTGATELAVATAAPDETILAATPPQPSAESPGVPAAAAESSNGAGPGVPTTAAAESADAGAAEAEQVEPLTELGDPTSDDPRLVIRWEQPALCAQGQAPSLDRDLVLARFLGAKAGTWTVYLDPAVPPERLGPARDALDRAHSVVWNLLGPQVQAVPAPDVFLYSDVNQLLDASCVNRAARGYYDGAIHVAADWDLEESLLHEYVHHVLLRLGVRSPMWLHEGLAIFVAGETWWKDPRLGLREWLVESPLPFVAMVTAFPHTSDELFAGAAYFQALAMTRFVHERGAMEFSTLVAQLASGALEPRAAFASSTGLSGEELEDAFRRFAGQL